MNFELKMNTVKATLKHWKTLQRGLSKNCHRKNYFKWIEVTDTVLWLTWVSNPWEKS